MLILASASKARSSLLNQAGIKHLVIPSNIDETKKEFYSTDVNQLVGNLAREKVKSVLRNIEIFNDDRYEGVLAAIGCDSVFEFQGKIYGKPENSDDARKRLEEISGNCGILHTAHCLFSRKKITGEISYHGFYNAYNEVISSRIEFIAFDDNDIDNYLDTLEPLNCAGCFNIEGRGGLFINRIDGCFSNIIGLSLPWMKQKLSLLGCLHQLQEK